MRCVTMTELTSSAGCGPATRNPQATAFRRPYFPLFSNAFPILNLYRFYSDHFDRCRGDFFQCATVVRNAEPPPPPPVMHTTTFFSNAEPFLPRQALLWRAMHLFQMWNIPFYACPTVLFIALCAWVGG